MKPKVDYSLEHRMNSTAKKLGIDYRILWQPDPSSKHDAMIFPDRKLVEIYATSEVGAWNAFVHEVIELRLRDAIACHVGIENTLLTLLQQIAYRKKEEAIDQLVRDLRVISEEPGEVFNLTTGEVEEAE